MDSRCTTLKQRPRGEWSEVASRVSVPVRSGIGRRWLASEDGGVLTRETAWQVAHAEKPRPAGMMLAAGPATAARGRDVVTYVVNRNINSLTFVLLACKFCAFSRGPRESDAYFLSLTRSRSELCKPAKRGRRKYAFKRPAAPSFRRFITATCFAP